MKKHFLGFALFGLIVGTALAVGVLLKPAPEMIEVEPAAPLVYDASSRSCWKNAPRRASGERAQIKVTQAVLNERSRKLNLDFFVQRETPSTQDVKVKLTFFSGTPSGDGWAGTVNSDYVTLAPGFDVKNQATSTHIYKWSSKLAANENLYVLAELADGISSGSQESRRIDYSDLTPVLLTDRK